MAVLVTQQVAASEEQYRAVNDVLDTHANPPPGLIVHTGGPIGDGELRVVDVWESAEAFESLRANASHRRSLRSWVTMPRGRACRSISSTT